MKIYCASGRSQTPIEFDDVEWAEIIEAVGTERDACINELKNEMDLMEVDDLENSIMTYSKIIRKLKEVVGE